jgi:hypothetical protein
MLLSYKSVRAKYAVDMSGETPLKNRLGGEVKLGHFMILYSQKK